MNNKIVLTIGIILFCSYAAKATADLKIDISYLVQTIHIVNKNFAQGDCDVSEGCAQAGLRKLLKFGLRQENIGTKAFDLGKISKKPYFTNDPCHKHDHFDGFAKMDLFDVNCNVAVAGGKLGGCMFNYDPVGHPNAIHCNKLEFRDCVGKQGISAGCADVYDTNLPCQYIDITDNVPDGKYFLKVRINWDQALINAHSNLQESDYTNNTAYVLIEIQGNTVKKVIYAAHTIPHDLNVNCTVLSKFHEGFFNFPPSPVTRLVRNDLTANCNITSNGVNVTFIAGNSIRLTDGFRSGDNFRAYTLDPCLINLRVSGNSEILFDDYTIQDITQDQTKDNTINDEMFYQNDGIHLYPNPSSGIFNLSLKFEQEKKTKIVVYNIFGKEIYVVSEAPILQKNYQINLSSQPNGIYIVRLITNDEVINKKIILSK